MTSNVLVLAGTADATRLATVLDAAGHRVTSSLAGVTSAPSSRPGQVRSGGFGGWEGLAAYLAAERFDAVVDATHPFAAHMPFNVARACERVGVPHCRLMRPAWQAIEGDRWVDVATLDDAPAALDALDARRVFLAIGRQSLGPFADRPDQWFLVRSIEPPAQVLVHMSSIQTRGPFELDGELALLTEHAIDAVVAKNAGGTATAAKLVAARQLGLPVVMVARPLQPAGVEIVATVNDAHRWLDGLQTPAG